MDQAASAPLPQPSGDALFDAYSALIAAKWPECRAVYSEYIDYLIEWHKFGNLRGEPEKLRAALQRASEEGMPLSVKNRELWARLQRAMEPELLPVAELRALEPAFGGDPRYWQLLHWAARQQRLDPEVDAWHFPLEAYSVLLEARSRGAVDGATLLLLAPLIEAAQPGWATQRFELQGEVLGRMAREAQQARKQGGREIPPPKRHEQAFFDEQAAGAQALAAQLSLDMAGLYQAAVEASPDWAQIHYQQALMLHRAGHNLDAFKALTRGNEAARKRLLKPYPQSIVRELALRGELAGSMKLFWDIEMHSTAEHEPELFIGLRTLPAAVAAELPGEQRLNPTTQLMRLLARSGSSELASGFECQIASIALSKTLESTLGVLAEHGGNPERLKQWQGLNERLRTAAVNSLQQQIAPDNGMSDEQMRQVASLRLDWDGQRAAMEPLYQRHFEQLGAAHRFCQGTLWPLLREAERIDLVELLKP